MASSASSSSVAAGGGGTAESLIEEEEPLEADLEHRPFPYGECHPTKCKVCREARKREEEAAAAAAAVEEPLQADLEHRPFPYGNCIPTKCKICRAAARKLRNAEALTAAGEPAQVQPQPKRSMFPVARKRAPAKTVLKALDSIALQQDVVQQCDDLGSLGSLSQDDDHSDADASKSNKSLNSGTGSITAPESPKSQPGRTLRLLNHLESQRKRSSMDNALAAAKREELPAPAGEFLLDPTCFQPQPHGGDCHPTKCKVCRRNNRRLLPLGGLLTRGPGGSSSSSASTRARSVSESALCRTCEPPAKNVDEEKVEEEDDDDEERLPW